MRTNFPSRQQDWDSLSASFPQHTFYVVAQPPAPFLFDLKDGNLAVHNTDRVFFYMLNPCLTGRDFAKEIEALHPNLVICAGGWLSPFDWFPLNDALVSRHLKEKGIDVLCPTAETAGLCLDKCAMQAFFEQHAFCTPKTLCFRHELFFSERRFKEIERNVYKEYMLEELERLTYPIVVKDATGLSSYKMEVLTTPKMAKAFLLSGKNNADKIVQEYIMGLHCGVELYCAKDAINIFPPFLFSVNKYGLTSPKQSVKLGPLLFEKNPQEKEALYAELRRLARLLNLRGAAQVDLIFDGKKWYFLEVNPRLSGMSETVAASLKTTPLELLLKTALGAPQEKNALYTCNIKLPLMSPSKLSSLCNESGVLRGSQIQNFLARQEREKGYAELIFGGFSSLEDFCTNFTSFCAKHSHYMEESFVQKAQELCVLLGSSFHYHT